MWRIEVWISVNTEDTVCFMITLEGKNIGGKKQYLGILNFVIFYYRNL